MNVQRFASMHDPSQEPQSNPTTMKLSTLALAALTMGTAYAQQAAYYKKINQLRGADLSTIPRGKVITDDDIDQKLLNMCQTDHPDATSCNAIDECIWCECEAVPSACFSKQAAPRLPPRVYTCRSSSDAAPPESIISEKVEEVIEEVVEKVEQSWQATAEKATKMQSFLLEGVELNLATDEVAGDFCDATSPLSLAGYMNGAFSKTFHRELCVSPYVDCCLPSLSNMLFIL